MSIIYEALKKTQKKREAMLTMQLAPVQSKKPWLNLRLLVLPSVIFLAFSGAYLAYSSYDAHSVGTNKTIDNTLVLNGVFLASNEKIAMINNEEYKVGDKINNMSIVSIDMNNVKLQSANKQEQVLSIA